MRAVRTGWLLALLAGCGLADYEQKMQESEARAARFDEQAKALGQPLSIPLGTPKGKEPPQPLARLFLRPPRGIAATPAKEPRSGGLFVYAATSAKAAAPFVEVMLAFGKGSDKGFHDQVAKAFPGGKAGAAMRYGTRTTGGPGTAFARTLVEAGDREYSVNTWSDGTAGQVSVIYGWNKAQRALALKPVDLSLESFAAGDAAGPAGADYQRGGPLAAVPR